MLGAVPETQQGGNLWNSNYNNSSVHVVVAKRRSDKMRICCLLFN